MPRPSTESGCEISNNTVTLMEVVTSTWDTGLANLWTNKVSIAHLKVVSTVERSVMESSSVKVSTLTKNKSSKESSRKMENSRRRVTSSHPKRSMRVRSSMANHMDSERCSGLRRESHTKDTGRTGSCMERVNSPVLICLSIRETLKVAFSTVRDRSSTLIAHSSRAHSKTVY